MISTQFVVKFLAVSLLIQHYKSSTTCPPCVKYNLRDGLSLDCRVLKIVQGKTLKPKALEADFEQILILFF